MLFLDRSSAEANSFTALNIGLQQHISQQGTRRCSILILLGAMDQMDSVDVKKQ